MSEMTIRCNHVPRPIVRWWDLTPAEQKEFDYLDSEQRQADADFVRYRGVVYDLGEFMAVTPTVAPHCQRKGWERFDGYHTDSFFSAVLMRYAPGTDYEEVIMATAFS